MKGAKYTVSWKGQIVSHHKTLTAANKRVARLVGMSRGKMTSTDFKIDIVTQ